MGRSSPPGTADEVANISSKTLAAVAFERLRDDILKCRLKPGDRLPFDDLKERYGISVSPLREALSRMTVEGLVVLEDKRGFHVAPVSVEDLADIASLRMRLESSALRDAIKSGGDEWEADIVGAFHLLSKYDNQGHEGSSIFSDDWERRHREFHLALISACGSPRLLELVNSLSDQLGRYRRLARATKSGPRDSIGEHRAILDAALARDADTACARLEDNFQRTVDIVLSARRYLEIATPEG